MKQPKYYVSFLIFLLMFSCNQHSEQLVVEVYETSAQGNTLKRITEFTGSKTPVLISLNPEEKFQTIKQKG